jgi:hypothetical protein
MKVIHNMKNIPIQEFQHYLESILIEVMKMKRLQIQFVSNVIDESDSQHEKQFDPRISIFPPISIADDSQKFRISL